MALMTMSMMGYFKRAGATALRFVGPATLVNGVDGDTYSRFIRATGGTRPYNFSTNPADLPNGLSLDANTGEISGTISDTPGTFTFNVTVTDDNGDAISRDYSIVVWEVAPTFDVQTMDDAVEDDIYSYNLSVSDGTTPFVFTITAGSLPTGLTLNASTGEVAGTPAVGQAGSYPITFKVTDAHGRFDTINLTLVVHDDLVITTASPITHGVVGDAYSVAVAAAGGEAPYTFTVSKGPLPDGLTLDSDGTLHGTPTTPDTAFDFEIQVEDANGFTQVKGFLMDIWEPAPNITTTTLPDGTQGVAYSQTVDVDDGTAPFSFSIAGTLPSGLSLDPDTGEISGTPDTVEDSTFTIGVEDAHGRTDAQSLTISIKSPAVPPVPGDYDFYLDFENAHLTKTGSDIDTFLDQGIGANDVPNTGFGKLQQGAAIDGYSTLAGSGGLEWYRSSGNGSTMINSTGGVFYFAAKLTDATAFNMFLNCPTLGNGSIQVVDVSGTPTLRVAFGSGGAGHVAVDVPFTLNQLNFVTVRFFTGGGNGTLKVQVNNDSEGTDVQLGDQWASLAANGVDLFGGTFGVPKGQTLFFVSKKGYPSDADVVAAKASFKAKYASLPV